MNDSELIALYFARDESAADETQKRFGRYCYKIAHNILGSAEDAEECVNDVLLRLWTHIPPAKPENLYAYIASVTRATACSRLTADRAQKRGGGELPLVLDELRDCTAPDTVEQQLEMRRLSQALGRFLSMLKAQHRIIFVQRYWYCCPVSEIAENLNITKSKVTVTLMRTRQKLRTYLEEEGFL